MWAMPLLMFLRTFFFLAMRYYLVALCGTFSEHTISVQQVPHESQNRQFSELSHPSYRQLSSYVPYEFEHYNVYVAPEQANLFDVARHDTLEYP